MPDADLPPIVIDNGSGTCKVGSADRERPDVTFPSIIGHTRNEAVDPSSTYIGHEAQSRRDTLSLVYPIEHGVVVRWKDMEKIWSHAIQNELHVATEDHPVLLTEAPLNPKAHREKLAEVMFESLNVPSLLVANQAPLSCYASGRTAGIVLDSGDGVTHAVPVHNRSPISHATFRIDLAGRDLTDFLVRKLEDRHPEQGFAMSGGRDVVRDIKEKLCYVALDYEQELQTIPTLRKSYELPDGQIITLDDELFRVPEALFQPTLLSFQSEGIHEIVHNAIAQCGAEIQPDLYGGVVLVGGSTLFPGMTDRLSRELSVLSPPGVEVKVTTSPKGQDSVWTGGSILASSTNFETQRCSKQEFEETGPSIFRRHGYI